MDARIQEYLRQVAPIDRESFRVGPFLATITPTNDNPYLNYAIPDTGAEPTPAEVRELIAEYRQRKRRPRLEYLPGIAPAVAPVLATAGFVVERQTPLMICTPGDEQPLALVDFELMAPIDDALLLASCEAMHEAFDCPPPTPDDVARMRSSLTAGGLAALARDRATGEVAGAGVCTPLRVGTTEVGGIGVRARYRRRGIGHALTARLASDAFTAGADLAFLMAATEVEGRLYARAGFRQIGDVVHISMPD